MPRRRQSYAPIIEEVFRQRYSAGATEVPFTRDEFVRIASHLKVPLPKNLGDLPYKFRYRSDLPASVVVKAPAGNEWAIFPDGRSKYRFVAVPFAAITPRPGLAVTKVPDATPGIIDMYALTDEQALLAKVRYNRLLDIFTGITTYSLQSHLRTSIQIRDEKSQVETDEIYVGLDHKGAHYVLPIQAKGGGDFLSVVQIWQDFKVCETKEKFSTMIAQPVATQFMAGGAIAMFAFDWDKAYGVTVIGEAHYQLVHPSELSDTELANYAKSMAKRVPIRTP